MLSRVLNLSMWSRQQLGLMLINHISVHVTVLSDVSKKADKLVLHWDIFIQRDHKCMKLRKKVIFWSVTSNLLLCVLLDTNLIIFKQVFMTFLVSGIIYLRHQFPYCNPPTLSDVMTRGYMYKHFVHSTDPSVCIIVIFIVIIIIQ